MVITYLTETPGILSVLKYLVDDNKIFFFLVSEEFFATAGWVVGTAVCI